MAGDRFPVVRVAAAQAAPVFLDIEATTAKACRLNDQGARVIVFPAGVIPGHRPWCRHHLRTSPQAIALLRDPVAFPGPEAATLADRMTRHAMMPEVAPDRRAAPSRRFDAAQPVEPAMAAAVPTGMAKNPLLSAPVSREADSPIGTHA